MPKTKRNKKQYGGEFLGEGNFGSVYGNPRLKCIDDIENNDIKNNDIKNTVSKIFKNDDEATIEFGVIERLTHHMNPEDLELLQTKYAILPIKKCKIDDSILTTEPYNSKEWRTGKLNERSISFFKDGKFTTENNAHLVIYDKGGDNLSTTFNNLQNATNINELYIVLQKLTNILEAIQILQRNNFVHGDIKPDNCIVDKDGNYRLIDMAEVEWIPTESFYGNSMQTSFMYFIWPPTAIYSYRFDENASPIDFEKFKQLFNINNEFNINCFGKINEIFSVFDNFSTIRIGNETISTIRIGNETISEIKKKLLSQKTFGMEFGNATLNIPKQIKTFNAFFAGKTREQFKIDLFKRCDIYSFGIMVLICIKPATAIINGSFEKTKELLTKLFKFVNLCCYQQTHVANINALVAFWKTEIIELITTILIDSAKEDPVKEDLAEDLGKEDLAEDLGKDPAKEVSAEEVSAENPDKEDMSSPKKCIGKECEVASSRGGSKKRRRNKRSGSKKRRRQRTKRR